MIKKPEGGGGKVKNRPPPEPFNDWGGRGCNNFFPVLGGDGTKIAPTGDVFDRPPSQMR